MSNKQITPADLATFLHDRMYVFANDPAKVPNLERTVIDGDFDLLELSEEILAMVQPSKSFSALIIEGNEAKKTCGQCGQLCVAYKEKFRADWITCLHAMEYYSPEVTYKQLADILARHYDFGEKAANNTARMFVMSMHWNVIEKTKQSIGRCPIYRITEYGREVLANRKSLPEFLWIPARGIEMDLSVLPQPTWTFAASVLPDDPNDLANKALHVEESLAAF